MFTPGAGALPGTPAASGRYLALDVETTGMDVRRDHIIAFAAIELDADLVPLRSWSQRFNPGAPIPAKATQRHGIRDADVASAPPFSQAASRLRSLVVRHTIIGYNVRFDLGILSTELRRCGLRGLPNLPIIDPFRIFCADSPRTLAAALHYYCHLHHVRAHDAMGDVEATLRVLRAQLQQKGLPNASLLVDRGGWLHA